MTPTSPPNLYAWIIQGVLAEIPSVAVVPQDTFYWATDTEPSGTLYLSDGADWNPVGGGGASSLWGTAALATFNGSGSPVGVVTPGGEGDLYVDTTGPGLWQATGVTASDWIQIGTGTGGDWGQASTAHFSGSGSPVGVVTPSSAGDLYVDTTGPGLWQATGTGDTDWINIAEAWGTVGNAAFSGSGSPVGAITPSAEGDLYLDTTTPGLWQATGTGDTDWQEVGTGTSGLWGEAATAQFAGTGSPVGVVTPNGEGDLYVDTDTPEIWQATGATNSDWQPLSALAVTDGTTTVDFVNSITFVGATVIDTGGGTTEVDVTGAGGGSWETVNGMSLDIASGDTDQFDWSTGSVSGDALLDFTDPANPVWVLDGGYVILFLFQFVDVPTLGDEVDFLPAPDGDYEITDYIVGLEATTANPSPSGSITMPLFVTAGDSIPVVVRNNSPNDQTVSMTVLILETGGGGGSVTDVTSSGGSINVTSPTTTPDLEVLNSPAVGGVTIFGTPSPGDVPVAIDGTDAEWGPPGAFTVSIANLGASAESGEPVGGDSLSNLGAASVIPVDTITNSYGTWEATMTAPLATYAAATPVFVFGAVTVDSVDTTNDDYDVAASVTVQNEDGSEQIVLFGQVSATAGGPGDFASVGIADMTVSSSTGTDLSYDTGTGAVTSAAGGNFSATFLAQGFWD